MTEAALDVSVIIPVDRPEGDLRRTLESLKTQKTTFSLEVILIGNVTGVVADSGLRSIPFTDRNPARRRNEAAKVARGRVLAFIDDDAAANSEWLETAISFLDAHPDTVAMGGPDPGPVAAPVSEKISDMLLAARWVGSGVLCHEARPGIFAISRAHDLALVNLFVRADAFQDAGAFDEEIGYIGEDTALLRKLMAMGSVMYHGGVVVYHRRRPYPMAYLAQRWRYRKKTGAMLVTGRSHLNFKILGLLAAGIIFVALLLLAPRLAVVAFLAYSLICLVAGASTRRLPPILWPLIPLFFLTHHATYFLGILVGAVQEAWKRLIRSRVAAKSC
ncbi:MAG TPA: glycosyltransferase [Thermoanaerobaculia bacterium]|nr:glycosyltransferase [Thermoanaerobaculia bacterium]